MQHVQEANLAWSLIDIAKPELDARERNHVFICIGAGDSFTAIRILLKLIAVKAIPMKLEVAQLCATWLEAYVLHEDHGHLKQVIDGIVVSVANRRPPMISRALVCVKSPVVYDLQFPYSCRARAASVAMSPLSRAIGGPPR